MRENDTSILGYMIRMQLTSQERPDEERITDENVIDEAITFLLAGHETTATTLSWTILLLLQHPDKLERLQREVDAMMDEAGDEITSDLLGIVHSGCLLVVIRCFVA